MLPCLATWLSPNPHRGHLEGLDLGTNVRVSSAVMRLTTVIFRSVVLAITIAGCGGGDAVTKSPSDGAAADSRGGMPTGSGGAGSRDALLVGSGGAGSRDALPVGSGGAGSRDAPFTGRGGADVAGTVASGGSGGSGTGGGGSGGTATDASASSDARPAVSEPDVGAADSDGGGASLVQPLDRGGGKYVLEFGDTYFEVSKAGARITSYRLAGHETLLQKGAAPTDIYFGSTLWASPQSRFPVPAAAAFDTADYAVVVDATSITMRGSAATRPQLSFAKKFSADIPKGAIVIEYSVKNEAVAQASWAAWEVTRVPSGGLMFFPILGAPNANTDLPNKTTPGYLWFDNATRPSGGSKIFADGNQSYLAHTDGTYLFVKSWDDVPKAEQAPKEGEVEIYCGSTYNELEVQGTYAPLGPGETRTLTVRWYLRRLPADAKRAVGDTALVSAAEALLP